MILAHHGADNGFTNKPFLARVDPQLAICSSDYDNQYDHPREEIRELLHERKIRLMTTKTGDVVVMSTGSHTGWCRAVNLKAGSTEVSSTFDFYSRKATLLARNRWPTSSEYRERVYAPARTLFTTTDLLSLRAVGPIGVVRFNARLLTHRALVLADLLENRWGVTGMVADLPEQPTWWINATSVETGKNWRFGKREMGDWVFGRHYTPRVRIAEAAAASAAVPYVIGALHFKVPPDGWYRTDPATREPIERIRPKHDTVRLWDGGAYENLGLETLFKPGEPLRGCDFLICSDASGPIGSQGVLRLAASGRLPSPRLFDICSDQIRALRSRMLVRAIDDGSVKAVLLKMGNSVRDIDQDGAQASTGLVRPVSGRPGRRLIVRVSHRPQGAAACVVRRIGAPRVRAG